MAHITPSRPQYKPEQDLTSEGQFLAQCRDVRYGLPNRKYPDGRPLMAIEFEVVDPDYPHLHGKLVSIVCSESVYRDPATKRESHLVTHARMMGIVHPELGFDPDRLIGETYRVQVERQDGRCYVRAAMPVGRRAAATARAAAAETPAPAPTEDTGPVPF